MFENCRLLYTEFPQCLHYNWHGKELASRRLKEGKECRRSARSGPEANKTAMGLVWFGNFPNVKMGESGIDAVPLAASWAVFLVNRMNSIFSNWNQNNASGLFVSLKTE